MKIKTNRNRKGISKKGHVQIALKIDFSVFKRVKVIVWKRERRNLKKGDILQEK